MKKLIKKLLRESLLREEMVSDISNLGLYHNPDYDMIGIYDPQMMNQGLEEYDYDKQLEAVKGGVNYRFNEKYDSYEIDSISAEKGYGPILYMILMTFAGDNGLMASRVRNQVSNDAKNVWQNFYDGKGSQYVEAIPLDSEHHDEDSLRHKYVIKTPVDTSKSVAINNEILSNDSYGEKDNGIAEAIESYIRNDMRDIYSEQEYPLANPPMYGDSDYEKRNGKIVNGSPKFFLSLVPKLDTNDEETIENIEDLSNMINNGQEIDPPTLYVDGNNVIDHDGRHRAYAAIKSGVNEIPILIIDINNKPITNLDLNPQIR